MLERWWVEQLNFGSKRKHGFEGFAGSDLYWGMFVTVRIEKLVAVVTAAATESTSDGIDD
jgi:hypothetical protein